jgi:hypothetical protein
MVETTHRCGRNDVVPCWGRWCRILCGRVRIGDRGKGSEKARDGAGIRRTSRGKDRKEQGRETATNDSSSSSIVLLQATSPRCTHIPFNHITHAYTHTLRAHITLVPFSSKHSRVGPTRPGRMARPTSSSFSFSIFNFVRNRVAAPPPQKKNLLIPRQVLEGIVVSDHHISPR